MRHLHQYLHRKATEASQRTTALQHAKMLQEISKVHVNYEFGLDLLKILSRNLDFAQANISAGLKAGSEGSVRMSISDILSQVPLLLKSIFTKGRNRRRRALVPIQTNINPQSNGDISIEVIFPLIYRNP
jgi:hypothetical protein